ncbi:hypothetical protein C9374_007508 [Naegleria lovaniensis]|uniref:Uncharacterized protein n=1 Tax=Naegleria lovaniensis TaxID=51637 RepID=A0AA88GKV2_NAELO|nr:uncharacterized protein C9374_007508 [Naegleria lovaniensis]KAG2379369.1 hypothetical protein C9374_007508 [Naegleria lovaniensis]
MNATFTNSGMTTSQQCTTNSTTSSTCMQDFLSSHCNHSSSSMNHDEPQVLLSNHVDKKISSRYTQLRKQLRACNNFKENYFVLEVNKPHQSNAKMSSETKSKKSSQKRKQQDKVEDMQVAQAPKKVKQNESTCSSETESLHASVTSGTNLHVNISQPEISENACVHTNSNPQDDMQIQLLHTLISSLQHVQQHPSNDISNNGNIATRTTTANPIMEKLLSTWFTELLYFGTLHLTLSVSAVFI